MRDVLYIQTDKNMKVVKEEVLLGEIAKLSCSNAKVLARNQIRRVTSLPKDVYKRQTLDLKDRTGQCTEDAASVYAVYYRRNLLYAESGRGFCHDRILAGMEE